MPILVYLTVAILFFMAAPVVHAMFAAHEWLNLVIAFIGVWILGYIFGTESFREEVRTTLLFWRRPK